MFYRPIIVKQMSFISCFCEYLARSWKVWQWCSRARFRIWLSPRLLAHSTAPCAALRRSEHLRASPQLLLRRWDLSPAAPSLHLLRHCLAVRCDSAAPVSHRLDKIICSLRACAPGSKFPELSGRASLQTHFAKFFFLGIFQTETCELYELFDTRMQILKTI